jgi:predicted Fe-Mo cluster-binding NifX family protein
MRICIPTGSKEGKTAVVYGHFGSAPFFTVYDTKKDSVEIIENANEHHEHGMCNPMGNLRGKNIDAVVCGGMGGRAVQKLNEDGIKAYRASVGTVKDIAEQYVKGGLQEITVQNACAQHDCH